MAWFRSKEKAHQSAVKLDVEQATDGISTLADLPDLAYAVLAYRTFLRVRQIVEKSVPADWALEYFKNTLATIKADLHLAKWTPASHESKKPRKRDRELFSALADFCNKTEHCCFMEKGVDQSEYLAKLIASMSALMALVDEEEFESLLALVLQDGAQLRKVVSPGDRERYVTTSVLADHIEALGDLWDPAELQPLLKVAIPDIDGFMFTLLQQVVKPRRLSLDRDVDFFQANCDRCGMDLPGKDLSRLATRIAQRREGNTVITTAGEDVYACPYCEHSVASIRLVGVTDEERETLSRT